MKSNKENAREEIAKVKGMNSAWWFAVFCTALVSEILYIQNYKIAAGVSAPVVFLAITIPVFFKEREFRRANKDEMFDLAYGKICASIIDSAGALFLALVILLNLFPAIPAYIVLAFVGALIYGTVFFRYYRWLKGGVEK